MSKKNDEADVTKRSGRFGSSTSSPGPAPVNLRAEEKRHLETFGRSWAGQSVGSNAEAIARAAFGALDQLSIGVAIVDARSHIVWANRYCNEVLAEGDGLAVIGGALHAANREQTAELNRLVGMNGADCESSADEIGVMTLSRPSGSRSYLVAVRPLSQQGPAAESYVAVFVTDPQQELQLDAHRIATLFDLTQSESQLAARLAAGKRLDRAATELGVATGTARTHLKHIFQKTETGRQSELSRLLRALLGKLRWN